MLVMAAKKKAATAKPTKVKTKTKNPAAVALGKLGGAATKGLTGIKKGLAAMTLEQRAAIRAKGLATRRARKGSAK